jgi:hypothetical protein
MTADEVLDALSRYTKDSMDSDRQTATEPGIWPPTLEDRLSGRTRPQKCTLARVAGFLRRAGYLQGVPTLSSNCGNHFHDPPFAVRKSRSFKKVAWLRSASRDKLSLLFVESDRGSELDCS